MPDMTEEQQAELPKNVITRALGMQDTVTVDLVPAQPQGGRPLPALLGRPERHGHRRRDRARSSPRPAMTSTWLAKRLIECANEHGGEDNCTVVLVAVSRAKTRPLMHTRIENVLRVTPEVFWKHLFFDAEFNDGLYRELGFESYEVLELRRARRWSRASASCAPSRR